MLAKGGPLLGTFLSFPNQRLVEFSGLVGFDWVLLDGEHEGLSIESCYELVTAADAVGLATVVRVPVNRPDVILGYADSGVDAVIAPHVTSVAEAESLVSSLRFPPRGTRGAAGGSRAANYGLTQSPREYFEATENHPVAAALLEDVAAYDCIEEIARVDGLDICCLGASDLAGSLGLPGQADHPDVTSRTRAAITHLRDQGVVVNMSAANARQALGLIELGVRMVVVSNITLLAAAARDFLTTCRVAGPEVAR
jgi:4-hydroxy-2-oxoheptanedioate aldolase